MTGPQATPSRDEGEERIALADLLDRCRDEIVARWTAQVRAVLHMNIATAQLRNAIPDYLRRLASALRGADPLEESGAALWTDIAREHALTRVRLGFDIDQLLHEFIVLRRVLAEVCRERLPSVDYRQAERIADLIEAAMSVAVCSYVQARDYAARKREAEHVAFITHELRNPLSAVRLAVDRLRGAIPEENAWLWEILDRNAGRLSRVIDTILHIERLEAGKVQARPIELELGELLADPLERAKLAAEAKGLAVRCAYEGDVLLQVDRELTSSAVANVLDNAVKYTDSGEIRVVADIDTDRVTLHVWDNCPGLSEAELQVVFEPFERGHSTKPGSGLGLAIARRSLEAQGGTIGAESKGERGCHFWISLPRAPH